MANWDAYDDYGYYGRFPTQPSAATTRSRAQTALAALKKKKGATDVAPVVIAGRTIASTFWGKAWCENLERYSDYANRLPRGRTYVRSGAVLDLRIARGRVTAEVQGSRRYQVEIDIDEVSRVEWKALITECAGKLASVVELLGGKLPKSVMEIVTRRSAGLFPSPKQIHLSCSCPDGARMCKHVAATLYGVGNRLDAQPELLFTLRHVDATELVGQGVARLVKAPASKGRSLDGDLAAIFDVELAPATGAATTPKSTRATAGRRTPKKGESRSKNCAAEASAVNSKTSRTSKTATTTRNASKKSRKRGAFTTGAESTRRSSTTGR